jgi:hypothetical protein
MGFIKSRSLSVLLLVLMILSFSLCTHKIKANSYTDDKCYNKNNKIILGDQLYETY